MTEEITSRITAEICVFSDSKKYKSKEDAIIKFEKSVDEICANTKLEYDSGEFTCELGEDDYFVLSAEVDFTVNGWCKRYNHEPYYSFEPPEYEEEMEADEDSIHEALSKISGDDYEIESICVSEFR